MSSALGDHLWLQVGSPSLNHHSTPERRIPVAMTAEDAILQTKKAYKNIRSYNGMDHCHGDNCEPPFINPLTSKAFTCA